MLTVSGLTLGYGSQPVVDRAELTLARGEVVSLVGANGAGKSTLVKGISGLLSPMVGHIVFEGERIDALSPRERLRRGIVHVPEGRQVFAAMTVMENLTLGGAIRGPARMGDRIAAVCDLFPVLRTRMGDVVGNFSGGQQQMLAIARGMMSEPKLLILDEPSLGLSPLLVGDVFHLIGTLRRRGLTVLLAEQNARAALAMSDRGYIVENGRIGPSEPAADLLASPDIAERYLGGKAASRVDTATTDNLSARLRAAMGTHA